MGILALDWRFLDVFRPIESVAPYQGTYEPWLVATSVSIAILAAFVALSISSRLIAATSWRGRWAWASAGALSMGGGIWAMHFVGMVAFSLPCGISYDPIGTLLSMIPGILASGVALHVMSRVTAPSLGRTIAGAVLMGAGIGAMHYSGMAAMRPEALVRYQPSMVVLSVIVAIVLAFISLEVRFRLRRYMHWDIMATVVAASIMGFAVSGMHYTAMQASVFFPLAGGPQAAGVVVPTTLMASLITVISVLIAVIALVASVAGRQWELASGLQAEISRRRVVEQEAEGGRARLQAIFDAVVDAIVTIDRAGRILQWSSGAQRIFGYLPEEVVGADLTMLMPEPHRSGHGAYVASFLKTRHAKIIGIGRELTAIRKDGTEFPIELAVSEVRDGDEIFFTGILRDITERKRSEAELVRAREEAEAANLAKSQFLATMSHEIRTPMSGVLGMANLLSSTPLNGRQRRLVDNVLRSGQALLGIINDILDFAKIEAGKFELSALPFDLREVIAEVTDLFTERCAKKGLELIYYVAEDVPSRLVGDPVRLRQVLVNLIGNAIKFTERGEILIEISNSRNTNDKFLNFAVEDTGIGIEPEQCAHIFESFHQVDGTMSRARGGSGLGLSITRQLVELMGGGISVESELGRGSRFSFTARFDALTPEAEAPRGPRYLARPLRTLLVDANAVSAHVISLYLTNWQVDPTIVLTIEEAEIACREATAAGHPIDVVILDVKGLGASAIEFARATRAKQDSQKTEVILLVGLDDYMSDRSLETIDAIAILPKPVRPSELFNALVSISSEGTRRTRLSHSMRRRARNKRPTFAARVLVAEDNAVNQEVTTGMLEAVGCQTVSAPNGRAAFRLFAQEKFDLILMDCEMPIMDGIEATRRIREIEAMAKALPDESATRRRTPVIALTAHALYDVRQKCLAAGMDDFLVKPIDDQQLAETLARWLSPQGSTAHGSSGDGHGSPSNAQAKFAREAVIDMAVIEGLRALDRKDAPSRLARAVSFFAEVAPPLAITIREQCEKSDAESLWRAAHSLKSSAGALGARRLSQRCAEIEAHARNLHIEATRPLVEGIDGDLAAAMRDLQALIGEPHVSN